MQAVNSTDTEAISLAIRPPSLGKPPAARRHGAVVYARHAAFAAAGSEPPDLLLKNLAGRQHWWHGRRWKNEETNVPALALYEYRGAELCDHSAVKRK